MMKIKLILARFSFFPCENNAFVLRSQISSKKVSLNRAISTPDLGESKVADDDGYYPMDPAQTTAQLLASIWNQINHVAQMEKGDTYTVTYPNMLKTFSASYIDKLLAHLDGCKDVCDHFGVRTNLMPFIDQGKIVGFTAKSYSGPENLHEEMTFEYDPFWDDDDIGDYSGVDEEMETKKRKNYPEIVDKVPDDDDKIIDITKSWVAKFMSDMGVCPFTSGSEKAGLPMGSVFYIVDRCKGFEETYAQYWKEVVRVEGSTEKELSTTLMICPEFCLENVEQFECFSNTLTQSLTGLKMEALLQLVFFHPDWTFRDGGSRFGEGMAANYARRSPWPMINILRTKQVRSAQKSIPTGLVYTQNEKTLRNVGVDRLETMLRLRNWDDIADVKVNRRDREALRVAQDFQETGSVKEEDLSFENDETPVATRIDFEQMEQGDMVEVMKQALKKRLGLTQEFNTVTALSGPETSAAIVASEVIQAELEKIISGKQSDEELI